MSIKETRVQKIAEHLKITPEKMCIGDQDNDLAMLQYAGLGVAMGNAPEEIKKVAKFITLSNKEHGVKRLLINLFKHDIFCVLSLMSTKLYSNCDPS